MDFPLALLMEDKRWLKERKISMNTLYQDRSFEIELEEIGFLYFNESVKSVCEYVDMCKKEENDFPDGRVNALWASICRIEESASQLKRAVSDMLYHAVIGYLKLDYLVEGSRFHDYLMYDALLYYIDTHPLKVGNNSYRKVGIEITDQIVNQASELHACSCGHKPIVEISPFLINTVCVRVICPCCGTKTMRVLNGGQMIKTDDGTYDTEHTYNNLEEAISHCIKYWKIQCAKTMEYKALELLISEFSGRLDVTARVREYSQLLLRYVRRNGLDKEIGPRYRSEIAEKLYQDKKAMEIVNDYLWENSSNNDSDGMRPLETCDFSAYSLVKVN